MHAVAAGAGQRRGQVVDDHRLGAALGLRALAGIVDDERIEMRQWRQHRLGEALGRQRQRLPRQPFERAVLAEMDYRVGAEILGEPGIGGEIAVRRHQCRIVLGRLRIDVVAARRLDQHRDIAGAEAGNCESAAIEPPGRKNGSRSAAPQRAMTAVCTVARQGREKCGVVGEGKRLLAAAAGFALVGPASQPPDQRLAVFRHSAIR